MNRTDYRFTLTRDTDTFEVVAHNFFSGSFVYEQEEGQLFFRRKFNGDLIFKGSDYAYFKGRYDLNYYCDVYDLLIEKKVNGSYETDWLGYFSMTDGKFDFEKCEFEVEPTVSDQYDCILNNYDLSYNVLEQSKFLVTSYIASKVEYIVFPYSTNSYYSLGSVLVEGLYLGANVAKFECVYVSSAVLIGSTYLYFYVFAREVVLLKKGVVPTGADWLVSKSVFEGWTDDSVFSSFYQTYDVITGLSATGPILNYLQTDDRIKWARPLSTAYSMPVAGDIIVSLTDSTDTDFKKYIETYSEQIFLPPEILTTKIYLSVKKTWTSGIIFSQKLTYTNAVILNNTISFLLNKTCPGLAMVSAFLTDNINPVTQVASKTNNLRLLQKSDIKKPQATEPASKGEFSLKDILDLLYVVFQLYWYIDGNMLYLIHESEIDSLVGLDITSPQYIATTAHKKAIEFNDKLLYRYEKWELTDADNEDFVGTQIEYSEYCTPRNTDAKTKSYNSDKFSTDLAYIQIGGDDVSNTGFCLVSCDSSNEVNLEIGLLSNSNQLNGPLAISNFQDKYWRHNRILQTGLMNGVATTFTTVQEIRKLKEQQIVLCEDFNPLKKVKTELGNTVVNEAEFFPLDSKLVLNLSI